MKYVSLLLFFKLQKYYRCKHCFLRHSVSNCCCYGGPTWPKHSHSKAMWELNREIMQLNFIPKKSDTNVDYFYVTNLRKRRSVTRYLKPLRSGSLHQVCVQVKERKMHLHSLREKERERCLYVLKTINTGAEYKREQRSGAAEHFTTFMILSPGIIFLCFHLWTGS